MERGEIMNIHSSASSKESKMENLIGSDKEDYSDLIPSACDGAIQINLIILQWLIITIGIPSLIRYVTPQYIYISYLFICIGLLYLIYSLRSVIMNCILFPLQPPAQLGSIEHAYTGEKQTKHIQLKKVYIIFNPAGGKGISKKSLNSIVLPLLQENNIQYNILTTNYVGNARDYAKTIELKGYDGIIVLGGDGTLAEVVNGFLIRPGNINNKLNPPEILPIGLVPCGTGNSFSLDCGNKHDATLAMKRILQGEIVYTDVNLITDSSGLKLYSINEISFGLVGDAAVAAEYLRIFGPKRYDVAAIWMMLKSNYHRLSYNISGINSINNETPSKLKEISYSGTLVTCFINQTQHFGNALRGAPKAKLDDGLFDFVECKSASRGELFGVFSLLPTGAHLNHKAVQYVQAKQIQLKPEKPIGVMNVDGEIVKYSGTINIECIHKVIPIILPPGYAS